MASEGNANERKDLIAELVEALRPLAEAADELDSLPIKDASQWSLWHTTSNIPGKPGISITAADARRARVALARAESATGSANVIGEIAAERRRQIEEEGWSAEQDDRHTDGSLAMAACAYADPRPVLKVVFIGVVEREIPICWPGSWDYSWYKPKDRRRNLIVASALIVAEIERLDRATEGEES